MKLDDTLLRILRTIQVEVREKFDKDYDVEELHDIVNTQMEATKLGFARSITVHWSAFGKFVFTNKVGTQRELMTFVKNTAVNEDLLPHEKEQLVKEKIIQLADRTKEKLATSNRGIGKDATVVAVLNTEVATNVKSKLFVNLINKHTN